MYDKLDSARGSMLMEADADQIIGDYQRLETVLIVEDERDLNQALSVRLQAAGVNVASAYDGIAGLEKVGHLEPDLIILDLKLPRLHGYKLLESLRLNGQIVEAPIVIMSGDPSPDLEAKARHWGVSRVFRKPVRVSEVAAEVVAMLNGQ